MRMWLVIFAALGSFQCSREPALPASGAPTKSESAFFREPHDVALKAFDAMAPEEQVRVALESRPTWSACGARTCTRHANRIMHAANSSTTTY